jgi:methionyl-tRNA formyltransferase
MVNLHFSLLPRWRGAAPVERALLAGDAVTGVCVMEVAVGLDTGDVYAREEVAIEPSDTLETLRGRLVHVGTRLLVDELTTGLGTPAPQEGEAVYAAKIDPGELRIDWTRPAAEIDRLVRLGGAWTTLAGRRLRIVTALAQADGPAPGLLVAGVAGTAAGGLRLVTVQPEGRAAMPWASFANGARLPEPAVLDR